MQHEKIFKREDGSKVKISVSLGVDFRTYYWNVAAYSCAAGKRKFSNVSSIAGVSLEEIQEVKKELLSQITI